MQEKPKIFLKPYVSTFLCHLFFLKFFLKTLSPVFSEDSVEHLPS